MTSKEIHGSINEGKIDDCSFFLQEIAYQLAVMNERQDVPKLKTNPFGVAHDEPSKGDAVASDCSCGFPSLYAELLDATRAVLINRRDQDFRRLRAAVDRIPKSVPSPPPEPAGQNSSPTEAYPDMTANQKQLADEVIADIVAESRARDLMKKTDREQNG